MVRAVLGETVSMLLWRIVDRMRPCLNQASEIGEWATSRDDSMTDEGLLLLVFVLWSGQERARVDYHRSACQKVVAFEAPGGIENGMNC